MSFCSAIILSMGKIGLFFSKIRQSATSIVWFDDLFVVRAIVEVAPKPATF